MSDKTTIKFEKTKTIIAKEMGYDDWETCINDQPNYMVEQVMDKVVQSYANQHLKDVLGEAEKMIFKESEAYKDRTAPKLELQRIGFKHGAYWLLNLLKQRKG